MQIDYLDQFFNQFEISTTKNFRDFILKEAETGRFFDKKISRWRIEQKSVI